MKNISEILQELIKSHKSRLSISELSRQTKIPQPTLSHILKGTTKNPRNEVLNSLAQFFSISVPQLMGELPLNQSIPQSLKESLKISTIPIIDWNDLKNWHTNYSSFIPAKEIILDNQIDKKSFALKVTDFALEPLFPKNSLLIFDGGRNIQDREFAVIYFSKTDKLAFNRIFIEKNDVYLKQDQADGNAQLIKLDLNYDKIMGILVESRMKY